MKNLLILFALFLGLGSASTQTQKPTKEETIAFIERTLNNSYNSAGPVSEFRLREDGFSFKTVTEFWNYKYEYKGVFFDQIKTIEIDRSYFYSNDNVPIDITFNSANISLRITGSNQSDKNVDKSTSAISTFTLAAPEIKAPSIIKAFQRLKEIYQEENKDPFK